MPAKAITYTQIFMKRTRAADMVATPALADKRNTESPECNNGDLLESGRFHAAAEPRRAKHCTNEDKAYVFIAVHIASTTHQRGGLKMSAQRKTRVDAANTASLAA